jgi:hypothetical protein
VETKLVAFQLTDELSRALDLRVVREGGDRSSLVREILSDYLASDIRQLKEWEAAVVPDEQAKKKEAWGYAMGINKIIGIDIDDDFKALIEKEIKGEITTKDMVKQLDKQYGVKR